jgi:hypothetical protein
MKPQKPLIRRTFLQERFMILIERQQAGEATFDELTELDELVNRDPKLRGIILEEMKESSPPADIPFNEEIKKTEIHVHSTLIERIWSFIKNLHVFYISAPTLSA